MHESPRIRRLRSDLGAMERLQQESSVLRFRSTGNPAQQYVVSFRGRSLARFQGKVTIRETHEVEIKLGASYPRSMPEIRWLTPIYHPNISEIGMVCLGGYGTHWVPSLNLDELCGMLWDMARYHNYDVRSPYNRESALWVANQTGFRFPLDARPLRDLRQALGRVDFSNVDPQRVPRPLTSPQPGTLASKYRDFLKKFASDTSATTGSANERQRDVAAILAVPPSDPCETANTIPEYLVTTSVVAESARVEDLPTTSVVVDEAEPDLILLESIEDVLPEQAPRALTPDSDRTVRLRASDEDILFID